MDRDKLRVDVADICLVPCKSGDGELCEYYKGSCSICRADRILALPAIARALAAKSLFQQGEFTLHSGGRSAWKVDCDALTDGDIDTLAMMISERHKFSRIIGVPRGGLRLASALKRYCTEGPTLIVDDVLTTGASMEALRAQTEGEVIGVVIFARGLCPSWVTPLWQDGATVSKALKALEDLEAGRLVKLAKDQGLEINVKADHFWNEIGKALDLARYIKDQGFRRVEAEKEIRP